MWGQRRRKMARKQLISTFICVLCRYVIVLLTYDWFYSFKALWGKHGESHWCLDKVCSWRVSRVMVPASTQASNYIWFPAVTQLGTVIAPVCLRVCVCVCTTKERFDLHEDEGVGCEAARVSDNSDWPSGDVSRSFWRSLRMNEQTNDKHLYYLLKSQLNCTETATKITTTATFVANMAISATNPTIKKCSNISKPQQHLQLNMAPLQTPATAGTVVATTASNPTTGNCIWHGDYCNWINSAYANTSTHAATVATFANEPISAAKLSTKHGKFCNWPNHHKLLQLSKLLKLQQHLRELCWQLQSVHKELQQLLYLNISVTLATHATNGGYCNFACLHLQKSNKYSSIN